MDNNEQNVYKILSKIFTEYLHSTIYFFNAHALAQLGLGGSSLAIFALNPGPVWALCGPPYGPVGVVELGEVLDHIQS